MGYWLNNWFSNMIPFDEPMVEDSITYPTVEHYYQAMKWYDIGKRKDIATISSPFGAKKRSKWYMETLKEEYDWEWWCNVHDSIMERALAWKFRPHTQQGLKLVRSFPHDLVEWNNWHDNYWGICMCDKCTTGDYGRNKLGNLLMKIRKEMMQD